jgi:hypothetical protein
MDVKGVQNDIYKMMIKRVQEVKRIGNVVLGWGCFLKVCENGCVRLGEKVWWKYDEVG